MSCFSDICASVHIWKLHPEKILIVTCFSLVDSGPSSPSLIAFIYHVLFSQLGSLPACLKQRIAAEVATLGRLHSRCLRSCSQPWRSLCDAEVTSASLPHRQPRGGPAISEWVAQAGQSHHTGRPGPAHFHARLRCARFPGGKNQPFGAERCTDHGLLRKHTDGRQPG